jgi:hydroxymethylbilane synthase
VNDVVRIGTRGSRLALIQSEWVGDQLRALYPALRVSIEVIHTKGDKLLDAPLAKIGDKGLFTKELEAAMLAGRTDLAVHSAKDMPTDVPDGLAIVAFTRREDVRDVFVAGATPQAGGGPARDAARPAPRALADLPNSARVGSSSLRRRSQLLALRPDLALVDIRGNVQTRLRKVEEQHMAGTILAAAGLARLEQSGLAAFAFDFDEMLPAVGQGSLAIEARADDQRVARLVRPLVHRATALAVRAERSLMSALQGGCQVPIAAHADLEDGDVLRRERLRLRAFVGSLDGRRAMHDELTGPAVDPEALGRELAARLLAAGADAILAEVRGGAAGAPEADLPNGADGPPDASSAGAVPDA